MNSEAIAHDTIVLEESTAAKLGNHHPQQDPAAENTNLLPTDPVVLQVVALSEPNVLSGGFRFAFQSCLLIFAGSDASESDCELPPRLPTIHEEPSTCLEQIIFACAIRRNSTMICAFFFLN